MQIVRLSAILLFILSISTTVFSQKMAPEDVLAKHLDSIGTQEKREAIKNQLAIGVSEFSILTGVKSKATGNAVIASESAKIFFGVNYNSPNYPFEKVSFDGNQVNIAFITPGLRSAFGNFILSHKYLFSEGIFGGSLSTSWGLLNLQNRKAKITFEGKKKIDGRECYVLGYSPKSGSDLAIKLFFDVQNFQHLRSEYRQTISAAQGVTSTNSRGRPVDNSARQVESRHLLTEEFSAFSDENGINLPHKYRIYLQLTGQSGTNEFEWKFEFVRFLFNQKLDPKSFDVNAE